jgi:two-component system chemotaxis response regulator CheB
METKHVINGTCPECRGPLSVTEHHSDETIREYKCLVGHTFSAKALLQSHSDAQEKALWAAVVALEEAANLVKEVEAEFPPAVSKRLQKQAELKRKQAKELCDILEKLEPFQTG